jgi:hypothetical protein
MPEPQGDCDDFAPLTAAMMVAAGFPVGLATVAHKAENPRMWTHVYAVTRIGGSTIGMDTAEGPGPGWEPPYFYRRCEWPVPIDLEAYRERLHGLGHFMQSGLLGLGKTDWGTLVHGVGTFIQGLQPGISGMGEIDWGSIVAGGFKTVGDITKARYGVPPSGTYIQTGPQGSTVIRPTPGTSSISLPGISNFSLSPTMLALLAIGLVALVMIGRR